MLRAKGCWGAGQNSAGPCAWGACFGGWCNSAPPGDYQRDALAASWGTPGHLLPCTKLAHIKSMSNMPICLLDLAGRGRYKH